MKKILTALLAALLAGGAQAILITNITAGGVLFDNDGFEQDTVGSAPTYAADGTIYTRNDPLVYTGTGTGVGVSACPDGAYEGDNYMYFGRVADDASRYGTIAFEGGAITAVGQTIRVDFAAYFGADAYIGMNLLYDVASSSSYTSKMTDWRFIRGTTGTGLSADSYATNEWVECSFVYTTGDDSATVTIGDTTVTGAVDWNTEQKLAGISFIGLSNDTTGVYLDSIPEPAAAGLVLLAGTFVLLLRRMRK